MKLTSGFKEQGIVIGNSYDKYGSRNPVVRRIMAGFEASLLKLVHQVNPASLHEVGCGEGYWTLNMLHEGIDARGSDFSEQVIAIARSNALHAGRDANLFKVQSIYDLSPDEDSANLIVCCEVLEHLERPSEALKVLQTLAKPYVIFSVPREPIWRVMNMARGKYWGQLGNTPGHLQHWSKSGFMSLVSRYFHIEEVLTPLPWTMILARRIEAK
jgi:hypothetical protein